MRLYCKVFFIVLLHFNLYETFDYLEHFNTIVQYTKMSPFCDLKKKVLYLFATYFNIVTVYRDLSFSNYRNRKIWFRRMSNLNISLSDHQKNTYLKVEYGFNERVLCSDCIALVLKKISSIYSLWEMLVVWGKMLYV